MKTFTTLLAMFLFSLAPFTHAASIAPCIIEAVEFKNGKLVGAVPRASLSGWWNAKLKLGSDDPDAYEFLTIEKNGENQKIRVETCQQYTNAIGQGAIAFTTADMVMEGYFASAVSTLQFMGKALPSTNALPDNFLSQLPLSLLSWNGSDERVQIEADTRSGKTLKDYVRMGKVTGFKSKLHGLTFAANGRDFTVSEQARGDWNGDGAEDALIQVAWHYQGGSGFGVEQYVFAKKTLLPLPSRP